MRSDDEVNDEMDAAYKCIEAGTSKYPGMTYEEGVDAALRWVMEWADDKPMSDD